MANRWFSLLTLVMMSGLVRASDRLTEPYITQAQKSGTCTVLAKLRGMEDYETTSFAVRCERANPDTQPQVRTDPSRADVLVTNDSALAAKAYYLWGLVQVATVLDETETLSSRQTRWDATVRRPCRSTECLQSVIQQRIQWLTNFIQVNSDPLPQQASGIREAPACSDDRADSFRLKLAVTDRAVGGELVGSGLCGNRVFDGDRFQGTQSGHLAFVTFEAGFQDEHQPAQALIVSRNGHLYWQVLTRIEVENYVWNSADLTAD